MVTQEDVRKIALEFPGVSESEERFGFSILVKGNHKGFIWEWAERVTPKKPKVLNPGVLAFSVSNLGVKNMILGSGAEYWVNDPHYDGYPAVLVRLELLPPEDLADLVTEAWRSKAPASLVKEFDNQTG